MQLPAFLFSEDPPPLFRKKYELCAWRNVMARTLAGTLLFCSATSAYGQTGGIIVEAASAEASTMQVDAPSESEEAPLSTLPAPRYEPNSYYQRQLDFARSPPSEPDGEGLWSDTKYFFFYQFFIIGILYVLPESSSNWSKEQKEQDRIGAYRDNLRAIVWDEDDHSVNYIGHPYFGSLYYARARERGYSPTGAFWYAAGLSATYEFGVEALFEKPSIQDLVTTPVLGSLLGTWFESVRNNIREEALVSGQFSGADKFILAATDLIGYLNSHAERLFGGTAATETEISLTAPLNLNVGSDRPLGLWVSVQF